MGRKKKPENERKLKEGARKYKHWTDEEIEELERLWGMYSIPTIAQRLERSVIGVRHKASELKLGNSIHNTDLILLSTLMREFGVVHGYAAFAERLKKLGFKIHTLRVDKRSYRMVDIAEFWEFAEKYPSIFDFSKLELYSLGKEPKWVSKIRADHYIRSNSVKTRNDKSTDPN